MRKHLSGKRHGYPLLIALAAIVLAFMGLSLAVTATGTASERNQVRSNSTTNQIPHTNRAAEAMIDSALTPHD